MYASEAQSAGKRHTEGIEGPQAFREALLLPESALIQGAVCEPVHMELSYSSVHQSKRYVSVCDSSFDQLQESVELVKMTAIPQPKTRKKSAL